ALGPALVRGDPRPDRRDRTVPRAAPRLCGGAARGRASDAHGPPARECVVAASIAAVTATLPFVWVRLAEWSPWGILATPALAPSMSALLALGWLRVLLGAAFVPDALLEPCARAMTASMRAFDILPFTPAPLPPRPD